MSGDVAAGSEAIGRRPGTPSTIAPPLSPAAADAARQAGAAAAPDHGPPDAGRSPEAPRAAEEGLAQRLHAILEVTARLLAVPIAAIVTREAGVPLLWASRGLAAGLPPARLLLIAPEALGAAGWTSGDAAGEAILAAHPLVAGAPHLRAVALAPVAPTGTEPAGLLLLADPAPRSRVWVESVDLVNLAGLIAGELRREARLRRLLAVCERLAACVGAAVDALWETDAELHVSALDELAGGTVPALRLNSLRDPAAGDSMAPEQALKLSRALAAHERFAGVELSRVLADRRVLWLELSGVPCFAADGRYVGYRGATRDITSRKLEQERTTRLAEEDELTGLPNRRAFLAALRRIFAGEGAVARRAALLMFDLDGFKRINDTLGHDAGDAALRETAARLRSGLRAGDSLARFGGDEFVALLADCAAREEVVRPLAPLLAELARPIIHRGRPMYLGASVGVALLPGDAADPDAAIKAADVALYMAKRQRRGGWFFHADRRRATKV
jgi:diguanylate cyclase (GGDEF)-like protein